MLFKEELNKQLLDVGKTPVADEISAQKFPAAPSGQLTTSGVSKNKKKEADDDDLAELTAWAQS